MRLEKLIVLMLMENRLVRLLDQRSLENELEMLLALMLKGNQLERSSALRLKVNAVEKLLVGMLMENQLEMLLENETVKSMEMQLALKSLENQLVRKWG